jgi:hypothetical protein
MAPATAPGGCIHGDHLRAERIPSRPEARRGGPTDGTLMRRIRGIGIRNPAGTALFQFGTGRLDKFQR